MVLTLSATLAPAVAKGRPHLSVVAQAPGADKEDDSADGPEAKAELPITLDDLIAVALINSPDLARAKSDRSVAKSSVGSERKSQAWVLSAGTQFTHEDTGLDPTTVAPLTTIAESQLSANLGLQRNLPTGGNVQVGFDVSHSVKELALPAGYSGNSNGSSDTVAAATNAVQSNCGLSADYYCMNQARASLTYKQPLLRGLGSDVALAPQRKAELGHVEATLKTQLAAEEMIQKLVTDYWELAYAAYEVDVRAEALDLAQQQEKITREELRAGLTQATSLNAVLYEIANRDEALILAKLTWEKKSLELRREAGMEIGHRAIVMRPKDPMEIGTDDFEVEDMLNISRRVNRKLADLELQRKIADVDVNVAKNNLLPELDVQLQGAVLGSGATADGAVGGITGGSGAGYQVTAGLTFSWEISGAARHMRDGASQKLHKLDIDKLDLQRQIEGEVVNAVKVVKSSATRVALSDKAITYAEENVRAERASFQMQRSTNFQVMQRMTELVEARLRRGRAVADYQEAVVQLQFLSGVLLEQYRVNVRAPQGQGQLLDGVN
ncbi:MAG TPA: TolC family protein [Kofleriaceae bacterium]